VLRRIAALVVVGLLVAGCGGSDDPPSPGPSPSGSTAPSASASGSAPVMPEAAKANTKAGAIAFVRFYVAAFNHARITGDTDPLGSLGTGRCVSCKDVRAAIDKTYAAGGHATGGRWVIDAAQVSRARRHQWVVYLSGHFEAGDTYKTAGAQPHHNNGGPMVASFFVAFKNGWKVVRWTRAA
jgi:hypothetical protein